MFSFDDHLSLAKAWGDLAVGCMTAATQASTAMLAPFAQSRSVFSPPSPKPESQPFSTRVKGWSSASTEPRRTSWYREPTRSPYEPWLGLTWAMPPATPTAALGPPQAMLGMLQPFQAWTRLLEAASPAVSAMPARWMGWPTTASLPLTAVPWMIGMGFAMVAPVPSRTSTGGGAQFAAYRSDSGHAVAQITFPNDVVAAVAVPSGADTLLGTFFPWMKAYV